eukprot:SAG11_NODE_2110_length_3805_cov_4.091203_4_plen_56_part_00
MREVLERYNSSLFADICVGLSVVPGAGDITLQKYFHVLSLETAIIFNGVHFRNAN